MDNLRRLRDQLSRIAGGAILYFLKFIRTASDWYFRYVHPFLLEEARRLRSVPFRVWRKYFFRAAFLSLAAALILSGGVYAKYRLDRSEIDSSLSRYKQWLAGGSEMPEKPPVLIYDRDGKLLGEYLTEKQSRITLNACSGLIWLKAAAVSAEDHDFYKHGGVSIQGISRAFMRNVLSLSIREGGGTITQQVARNLFTSRSTPVLIRKIYETYAAFQVEERMSKDEILCLYLNKIYMGEGRIGAEEASYFYFRKSPASLDAAEAAMIVGLFPSPSRYSPLNNIDMAMKKQSLVLDALARDGKIKPREKDALIARFKQIYQVVIADKNSKSGTLGEYGASRYFRSNLAPDVNDYAVNFLRKQIPEEEMEKGGLKVYTTVDFARQSAALSAVRSAVARTRNEMAARAPFPPQVVEQMRDGLNGVLISVNARSGEILAMVGGFGVNDSGTRISRPFDMKRQPGSAVKGFLYAVALDEEVIKEDDEMMDEPISIGGYRPHNWYGGYRGKVTMRQAVAMSINTVAVKILHQLGVNLFRDRMLDALDLSYSDASERFPRNLSLALGSGEVSPVELAMLYSAIVNGGIRIHPRLITRVENAAGETIWEDLSPPDRDRILSRKACASVIRLLESVVEEEGTAEWIARRRNVSRTYLQFPVAGKSGTVETEDSIVKKYRGMRGVHDAWFAGLVPGEVSIVWVGHDRGVPFPGSGGGTAGSIWAAYAQMALTGHIQGEFIQDDDSFDDPQKPGPKTGQDPDNPDDTTNPETLFNPDGSVKEPGKFPEPEEKSRPPVEEIIQLPAEKPVG